MGEALRLARKGMWRTSPNPAVGAVCVRDGRIVGAGYHPRAGEPHAEVFALAAAGDQARDGTLYVTLEPCSHYGRTPPCADRIIESGVKRVVVAMEDPNPRVAGKGIARLRAAGIRVDVGLRAEEARALNEWFLVNMLLGRAYVHVKTAVSADGKVACHTGASQWITGPEARAEVHRMRARHDAVLTGIGTVMADDPRLTVRLPRPEPDVPDRQPIRIIVDSRARIPMQARCLQGAGSDAEVIVAVGPQAPPRKVELLRQHGVRVWSGDSEDGRVDLAALLRDLLPLGIATILVESGPTLAGSLFAADLVDRLTVFIAPLVLGGTGAPSPVGGPGAAHPDEGRRLTRVETRRVGEDLLWTGAIQRWES